MMFTNPKPIDTYGGVADENKLKRENKNFEQAHCNNSEIEFNRILPNNQEAEIELLNAFFADPEAINKARDIIVPSDFSGRGGRAIFERLIGFTEAGRSFTLTLVEESFANHHQFDKFRALLDMLLPVTGQTVTYHSKIVLEMSLRRQLIHATYEACGSLFDPAVPIQEALDGLNLAIKSFSERNRVLL